MAEIEPEDWEWLRGLYRAIVACFDTESPMGPPGMHYLYLEEEGLWDVYIYPSPVELVGGAKDGAIVAPGFSVNLEELPSEFDYVEALGWDVPNLNFMGGPQKYQVYVQGIFQGRDVLLHILAYAPINAKPGMKFDATRK